MLRPILMLVFLSGCTGLAWNTTIANDPNVRVAMLASVRPGITTETDLTTRWGRPTQKIREGAETRYIYRDMRNPPDIRFPQFGTNAAYVVVLFQYGLAVGAYSSDTEGCRATFAPRPPGHGFDNPSTVHAVNCGAGFRPFAPERGAFGPGDGTSTAGGKM